VTEPRRRRDRAGRWFPGADPLGPGQGDGPDAGETTSLPGLSGAGGSPTALPTVPAGALPGIITPPDGVRGVSGVVDVARGSARGGEPDPGGPSRGTPGLPGVSGRGSIDSLPPFVETGPYDYDAYVDAATGPDWTAAPPRGSAPLPGDRSGNERQGNERQGNERQGNERQGNERQGGGRQAAERQSVERQAAERQANERPGNERQGGERALAGDAGLAVGGSTGPRAAGSGDLVEELAAVGRRLDELARLRRHDVELVDRLHEENGKLRQGELTEAMGPLLRGLIRLHDQMSSLGGDDPQSVAGILRKQLLQVLDISADVRPYIAVPGSPFDPTRHLALRGIGTDEPARDRTIARGVRPGFVRGSSTVLRPAEAEVYRNR
jgi:molecular chaperone GrpE (heat shock protein)